MDFAGLTITIGCPGSGKSTWADHNLPATTARLERDRFREAIFGSRRAYHDSPIEYEARREVLQESMGVVMQIWPTHSWCLSDTSLTFGSVEPFIHYADKVGAPIRLVIFERAPEFLRMCNRIRPEAHRVPDDLLENCIAQFFDPEAWWRGAKVETTYAFRAPAQDAA